MILPVFLALALGIIQATQLGMVAQRLANAARDGCRVAINPGSTPDDVQQRVALALQGSGIPVPTVTPSPANWTTAPRGTPISVTLTTPFRDVCWLQVPLSAGYSNLTLSGSATMPCARQ